MQVRHGSEGWYLAIACAVFIPAVAVVLLGELGGVQSAKKFIEVGKSILPWMVIAPGSAYLVVESVEMLAERYLRRRFREGKEEGKAEGKAEANRLWHLWYERLKAAQEEGKPFNEPPPDA